MLAKAKRKVASFESLARQYSESSSAKIGGYLGRVTRKSIDPKLWSELKKMPFNQISEVIRTTNAYHIVTLVQQNPKYEKLFNQVKEEIKANINKGKRSQKISQLITSLRSKAKVTNHLVNRYSYVWTDIKMRPKPPVSKKKELVEKAGGDSRGTLGISKSLSR